MTLPIYLREGTVRCPECGSPHCSGDCSKPQKRIALTHGTARVDEDCSQETIDALNRLSEKAYNHDFSKPTLCGPITKEIVWHKVSEKSPPLYKRLLVCRDPEEIQLISFLWAASTQDEGDEEVFYWEVERLLVAADPDDLWCEDYKPV